MSRFKSGDIIEGTEGTNESWAATTRMLIICMSKDDVCAVVLKEWHPVTMKEHEDRHHSMGGWTLRCRKWVKVGEVAALAGVEDAIRAAKEAWE